MVIRIGVISDTHGLLRPEAVDALAGSDHIVHAGDIGGPEILEALARIAPLTAIRGNNDVGPWAAAIPETTSVRIGTCSLYLIHNRAELAIDPVAERHQVDAQLVTLESKPPAGR